MSFEPLPFRIKLPVDDDWGWNGFEKVEYTITGLLHVTGPAIFLEWAEHRKIERLTWGRVGTDHEDLPVEMLEIPIDWVASLRLTGGWWAPRLKLQARRLDAFDGVPGADPGLATLWIARRDRKLAAEIAASVAERPVDPAQFRVEPTRRLPAFEESAEQ